MIEFSVASVAVAVRASVLLTQSTSRRILRIRKYEGLKLCDHSLTQCASSTQTRLTL